MQARSAAAHSGGRHQARRDAVRGFSDRHAGGRFRWRQRQNRNYLHQRPPARQKTGRKTAFSPARRSAAGCPQTWAIPHVDHVECHAAQKYNAVGRERHGELPRNPTQWRPRLICDCTEQFRMLTVRELRSLDTSPEFDHMRKSEALLRGFLLADAGLSQFAGANRTFPINGRNEPDQPRSSRPGGSAGVRRGGTVGSRSLAVMNGRPPHGYLFIAAAAGCPRGLARS